MRLGRECESMIASFVMEGRGVAGVVEAFEAGSLPCEGDRRAEEWQALRHQGRKAISTNRGRKDV